MGIGVSILMIAVGAILVWAVNASVSGVELGTIGVILLIVGAVGLVVALVRASWMPWSHEPEPVTTRRVDER